MPDPWNGADAYERYVGRWSRLLAPRFLAWAGVGAGARAIDVGCGTGALSQALLDAGTADVEGVDLSKAHVDAARAALEGPRARFRVGDATALDAPDASRDVAVSGLVLNFVPDPARMVREMARVVRPGGTVALYVWDYRGRMEMMRHFWDAAQELDEKAAAIDEAARFAICEPGALARLFRDAGLADVATESLDQPTTFADFDDYWTPFLGGQGPAPAYTMSLEPKAREALRESLRRRLPTRPDGSIPLVARAWAVKGAAPIPRR